MLTVMYNSITDFARTMSQDSRGTNWRPCRYHRGEWGVYQC